MPTIKSVYAPFGESEDALVEVYFDSADQVADYRVFHPNPGLVIDTLNKPLAQSVPDFLAGLAQAQA